MCVINDWGAFTTYQDVFIAKLFQRTDAYRIKLLNFPLIRPYQV